MSSADRDRRERAQRLMMAALDEEITAAERSELERLLGEDRTLRQEWERLSRVKEVTRTMRLQRPPEETWDVYFESVYNRLERGVAWVFVSLGAIILASYGIWTVVNEIFADVDVPRLVKLAIVALLVGGVILLVSVVRERLYLRKSDPYREIKR